MTIKTNGQARELVSWNDLPEKARQDFDYVEEEERWSLRFFEYRGAWYDTGDCQVIHVNRPDGTFTGGAFGVNVMPDSPFASWQGIFSESFFSAVLFRYVDTNFESVVVGYFFE